MSVTLDQNIKIIFLTFTIEKPEYYYEIYHTLFCVLSHEMFEENHIR